MNDVQEVPFTKAETKRLRALATEANDARAAWEEFVGFLYEQHEVKPEEGWVIGARGFELHPRPDQDEQPVQDAQPAQDDAHSNGAAPPRRVHRREPEPM